MTQPALSYFKRRAIASAIQSVAGVAETINPATNGFRLYDGVSGIEVDEIADVPDRAFFSGDDFAVANERAYVEGEFRLVPPVQPGHATDGIPEIDVALRAGGLARTLNELARTTRYTPISDDFEIATHAWWQAGSYKELFDSRHLLQSLMLEIGKRAIGKVRMQGYIVDLEEDDVESVTVSSGVGPVQRSDNSRTRISFDGGTPLLLWGKMFGIEPNSELKSEEYTEHRENSISDRKAAWKLQIARPALADFNPRAVRQNGTIVEVQMRLRSASGLYVELGIRGKLKDFTETDIESKLGYDLGGPCLPTSAGNDEFYLEFGDSTFRLNGEISDGVESVVYVANGLTPSGEYTGPLTYDISVGALPSGLTIAAGTGVISGTPDAATAGTISITIRATDSTVGTPKVATLAVSFDITA